MQTFLLDSTSQSGMDNVEKTIIIQRYFRNLIHPSWMQFPQWTIYIIPPCVLHLGANPE